MDRVFYTPEFGLESPVEVGPPVVPSADEVLSRASPLGRQVIAASVNEDSNNVVEAPSAMGYIEDEATKFASSAPDTAIRSLRYNARRNELLRLRNLVEHDRTRIVAPGASVSNSDLIEAD